MRPVNLFLSEDGVLKLGYYGLTTQAECYSIRKTGYEGIPSFAPEVFNGDHEMKSDVWSLGTSGASPMELTCLFHVPSQMNATHHSPSQHTHSHQLHHTPSFVFSP